MFVGFSCHCVFSRGGVVGMLRMFSVVVLRLVPFRCESRFCFVASGLAVGGVIVIVAVGVVIVVGVVVVVVCSRWCWFLSWLLLWFLSCRSCGFFLCCRGWRGSCQCRCGCISRRLYS